MKHTQGPWYFGSELNNRIHAINNVNEIDHVGVFEGSVADARLIAAAPELLEAIELFLYHAVDTNEVSVNYTSQWNVLQDAIKKAKGE